jgi:hypothetical protein
MAKAKRQKTKAQKAKARTGQKAKAFAGFREGSARAKVWAVLSKHLGGQKTVKMADVTKAVQTALKLSAEAAGKQAGLFLWTFVRAGLVTRAAKGEFTAVTKG